MTAPTVPLRVRPRRTRAVAWCAAVAFAGLFAALGTGLRGSTGAGTAVFQRGDQLAMVGLGVVGGLAILAFTRPRLAADAAGVRIRNVLGGYELPWAAIAAVRFDRHSAWASLELVDDDLVPVMAIQRADKQYAVDSVRRLRALLAASRVPDQFA